MKIKVGFLPLYLVMYDETCPWMRPTVDRFCGEVKNALEDEGLEVVFDGICRQRSESSHAIELFEREDVCAIITLHLAYSPSLETADLLCKTKSPVIVLDSTYQYDFASVATAENVLLNHGIHGVQDLCSVLKKNKKEFYIEAGHYKNSDVIKRVYSACRAAYATKCFRESRVGIIGDPFIGMGDFQISGKEFSDKIGATIVKFNENDVHKYLSMITDKEIQDEMRNDLDNYKAISVDPSRHYHTTRCSLILRKWLDSERLDAFTLNFQNINMNSPLKYVPFIEASKSMERGTGYAGEGDVLTAAFCGALLKICPETSFAEMFCPDWKGGSIFLSHMAEINPRVAEKKAILTEKDYVFSDAENPIVIYGIYKKGRAIIVDLAHSADGRFTMVLCSGEVEGTEIHPYIDDCIQGWFKPDVDICDFLKAYSIAGGTHHFALVYENEMNTFETMGKMLGFDIVKIPE